MDGQRSRAAFRGFVSDLGAAVREENVDDMTWLKDAAVLLSWVACEIEEARYDDGWVEDGTRARVSMRLQRAYEELK